MLRGHLPGLGVRTGQYAAKIDVRKMITPSDLVSHIERLSQARILCVGDLMLVRIVDKAVHQGHGDRVDPFRFEISNDVVEPGEIKGFMFPAIGINAAWNRFA